MPRTFWHVGKVSWWQTGAPQEGTEERWKRSRSWKGNCCASLMRFEQALSTTTSCDMRILMKPLRSASSRLVWETETVHRNRVAQVHQIAASLSMLLARIKKRSNFHSSSKCTCNTSRHHDRLTLDRKHIPGTCFLVDDHHRVFEVCGSTHNIICTNFLFKCVSHHRH